MTSSINFSTQDQNDVGNYPASFGISLGITSIFNALLVVAKETHDSGLDERGRESLGDAEYPGSGYFCGPGFRLAVAWATLAVLSWGGDCPGCWWSRPRIVDYRGV
jgi:hypothetical protein